MSLKSKVTCFQCSKILNNPIELPCRDTICSNHLQDSNCIKENKIKCLKCNQTFSIRDNNNFHCNQMVKSFLDEFKFLSLNMSLIEIPILCFFLGFLFSLYLFFLIFLHSMIIDNFSFR